MGNGALPQEQIQKHQNPENRRRAPRFNAREIPVLKSINQVGGGEVKLINISRRGALIESRERFLPGFSICLRLAMGERIFFLKGKIVRSSASSTNDKEFQSGINFDEDFKILPATINMLEVEDILK